MEQDLAILIADLSGYTALTEAHGAGSAADLIDKYISIVEQCLTGDCYLHERTGDEVMVVSTSPDHLLTTAIMLMQHTSATENFLQVHGGLHYGRTLKRNKSFFGTAINLTSRIAAKAAPGTFWCSSEYIGTLTGNSSFTFRSKGKHSFKNISEESEIFELVIDHKNSIHIDPVCRMLINDKEKATRHPQFTNILFCSSRCLELYLKTSL